MYPSSPYQRQPVPVVVRPARQCPNGMHLLLTVLTLGLWFPVWLLDMVFCAFSKPKIEYH